MTNIMGRKTKAHKAKVCSRKAKTTLKQKKNKIKLLVKIDN